MVSRSDVISAYRNILKREPENEDAIRNNLELATTGALYARLIGSEEFRNLYLGSPRAAPAPRYNLDGPAIKVEVETGDNNLRKLIQVVEKTWTNLGLSEPYWSVLTQENFRRERFAEHAEGFSQSGRGDANRLWSTALRSGLDLSTRMTCFELGCGVGRITRWLAERFSRVVAVDISKPHLEIARMNLEKSGVDNVSFVHLSRLEALQEIANFDVFFSVIVLQHNPPPVIAEMLRVILQNLKTGGVGYFQVPTYHPDYAFRTNAYLSLLTDHSRMEMHLLPQRDVFRIVESAGCRVLEIREDGATGGAWVSNSFLVEKPAA